MAGEQKDPARQRLPEQRLEHVARTIRVGEQLAVRLFMKLDAELAEERDRFADREAAKHTADDGSRPAPEVRLGDDGVRDVAARPAADKDLCARSSGALEEHDAE